MRSLRILGVDPGLSTIGLGLIEAEGTRLRAIDWLTITTPAAMPLADRLAEIHKDFTTFLTEARPDCAVVEQIFFAKNERTAIGVAHGRGVLLQVLRSNAIAILEPTPLQLKANITGDGRADKRQMQDMIVRILQLDCIPTPADAADALGLAIYGAYQGQSLLSSFTNDRR